MSINFTKVWDAINIPMVVQDSNFSIIARNRCFIQTYDTEAHDLTDLMAPSVKVASKILRLLCFEHDGFSSSYLWPTRDIYEVKAFRIQSSRLVINGELFLVAALFSSEFSKSFIDFPAIDAVSESRGRELLNIVDQYRELVTAQALEISALRDVIRMSNEERKRKER